MADSLYVGADWRSGRWVAVAFGVEGFDHAAVFDEVGGIWARYEELADRVLVDVPVGLPADGERECDSLAREVLGSRRSTVFMPPVREATRKRRYTAATRTNERRTGRGLSRGAFAASPGIAEVDELLREVPESRTIVAESHPEVCFRAFAGDPLDHSKTTAAGYAERMEALVDHDRDAVRTVHRAAEATAGHEVAVHDVVDAATLAYTARPGHGDLYTLPPDPPADAEGLPMRIHYRSEEPLVEE